MQGLAWLPDVRRPQRWIALEGTTPERVVRLMTAAVVVAGLWFRARGYLFSTFSLWLDEADWALHLMDWPLATHAIRPLGFMAITKGLALILGPSEAVLRFLPWSAGVATTLMAPALARRLFRSAASRLLFVSVIALHAGAIDLSKEFKQYSVALAFHTAIVLLGLRYTDTGKPRDLAYTLVVAFAAIWFAQDVVFAYPGLFLLLAISALRSRRFRHLAAVVTGALLTLGVVLCMYLFIWSKMGEDGEQYWGKKYGVFYVESKVHESKTAWTTEHYEQVAALPGSRRTIWESSRYTEKRLSEFRSLDMIFWILLHAAGVTYIARARKLREALLLVLPLLALTTFNVLGYWPLGDFRTNLFPLVYTTAIAALGIDRNAKRVRWGDFIPAGVLVLLPLVAFEKTWHAKKNAYTVAADFPAVMKKLIFLQGSGYSGPPEKVVADLWNCQPWDYYLNYNPTISRTLGPSMRRRFQISCESRPLGAARRELKTAPRVWILATKRGQKKNLDKNWPSDLERDMHVWVGRNKEHLLIAATPKSAVPGPPPQQMEPEPDAREEGGP